VGLARAKAWRGVFPICSTMFSVILLDQYCTPSTRRGTLHMSKCLFSLNLVIAFSAIGNYLALLCVKEHLA